MATNDAMTVVTVDDGTGPVAALKDANGRILTADQIQLIRDKQDADTAKVTQIKDQLVAGDSATTDLIVSQTRDELNRRLAMLERQRSEIQFTLDKLKAGDPTTTQDVVSRMVDRLTRRATLMTDARNRSDQLLTQVGKTVGATPVQPAGVAAQAVTNG